MKNSRLIIKEFKTVNQDLMVYLSKSNLTSIKLTFDMSSNNNQLKRTLCYNGSYKPLNSNTDEFWDLFISNPDRTMTNNRNQDYKLKSPPHRISTLISLLLKKYPNPVYSYDFNDTISKDAFRRLFSDLRRFVGEKVLPKGSRAFNQNAKIIIEKEYSNA